MAVDFNGVDSKVVNTVGVFDSSLLTICAWTFADKLDFGIMFRAGSISERPSVVNHASFPAIHLFQECATTNGDWRADTPLQQWNAVAISFDRTPVPPSTPIIRVNFTPATVTVVVAPVGAALLPNAGYTVGILLSTQPWDGMIAHLQVFNRILTAQEMDDTLRGPGSVSNGRVLWLRMCEQTDLLDYSGNGFHGTGTNVTNRAQDSPPCLPASGSNLMGQGLL